MMFFFKQKTAYEVRISDWSSDVCSSDLGLRPEVDHAVEKLFGRTFFLDRPNPRRLKGWRNKAQQEAAVQAGYAFQSYRSEEHTSELQSLMRISYAVLCLKKTNTILYISDSN